MKVFWSWQSDTPGRIGRHFVRDALEDAITVLKEAKEIEEPSERETREAIHLDHDRKGVDGSPDLAPTIFRKIDQAAVFVADVTLVGERINASQPAEEPKKLINSNVAIEYGYALRGLTDARILMVQNINYGERELLPFDLKHKAGPIQFRLPPEATNKEIATEQARLSRVFLEALKPYVGTTSKIGKFPARFAETLSTSCIAYYWDRGEVLASLRSDLLPVLGRSSEDDGIDYRFDEGRAFYLRLIPTTALPSPLPVTRLDEVVRQGRLQVLTRTTFSCTPARNRFGAIAYEPHGNSTVPTALTQLFRNGEIWSVTREFATNFHGSPVIPMVNVRNIVRRVLANFIEVATQELDLTQPLEVEIGAIGLTDMSVSLPVSSPRQMLNQISGPIYESQIRFRRVMNETSDASQNAIVEELYDLAAISV
jgi:hypothetical protein